MQFNALLRTPIVAINEYNYHVMQVSSESQEVFGTLLGTVATGTALQVLWFLLRENQDSHVRMNALLQFLQPILERTNKDIVQVFFEGENLGIFLKVGD